MQRKQLKLFAKQLDKKNEDMEWKESVFFYSETYEDRKIHICANFAEHCQWVDIWPLQKDGEVSEIGRERRLLEEYQKFNGNMKQFAIAVLMGEI